MNHFAAPVRAVKVNTQLPLCGIAEKNLLRIREEVYNAVTNFQTEHV